MQQIAETQPIITNETKSKLETRECEDIGVENMEIWKDIQQFEGRYQVSNYGRIKSLSRKFVRSDGAGVSFSEDRFLKPLKDKDGYSLVVLCKNGIPKTQKIHRLVMLAFSENIGNKRTVNHKNGIKSDNRLSNLEWATDQEQQDHAIQTGLKTKDDYLRGEDNSSAKLKEKEVIKIRKIYFTTKLGMRKIGRKYGVNDNTIEEIVNFRTWSHLTQHYDLFLKNMDKKRAYKASGEESAQSKLTIKQVKEIRDLRKSGKTQREIADIYNISSANVWHIANFKTWRDV